MQGFPFDSQLTYDESDNPIYDRAISSQPLRKLIRDLFTTGVMPNPSTNLQVSAGTDGMTVQVSAGFAVVDGGLCQEEETRTLEVTAADDTYDRIDTVVVRWNENVDTRTADLYIISGTPSANPVRPTLQRDNSIYEIGLADVFITRRVATITNDKITDTRYETGRCGIVSSVSEWDTTTIYQQVQADLAGFKSEEQAEFLAWFETIQNILDENVAAHLQGEIDTINDNIDDINDTLNTLSAATVSYEDTTTQLGANNVQTAIEKLKAAFSSALTALKATAIAQAVGATGSTFTAVIATLATIKDSRTRNKVANLTSQDGRRVHPYGGLGRVTNSDGTVRTCLSIPETGYYDTNDIIAATDAQIRTLGWLIPSGNKAITANGTNIDVKANATVSVNVHPTPAFNLLIDQAITTPTGGSNVVSINVPTGYQRYIAIVGIHRYNSESTPNVSGCGAQWTGSLGKLYDSSYAVYTLTSGGTFNMWTNHGWLMWVTVIGINS